MDATTNQRKIISKQAAIFDSRSAPAVKKKVAAEESPGEKLTEPEKTEKKGGFLSFFNKEKTSEPHSPRGKRETEVLHSPRRQLQRGATLQENASRETTRMANRKKFIKEFIATYDLKQKEFGKFLFGLQNSVVEMSREEYKALKDDPLSYCISYLNTYASRLITREETPQSEIDALWLLKEKLDEAKLAEENN